MVFVMALGLMSMSVVQAMHGLKRVAAKAVAAGALVSVVNAATQAGEERQQRDSLAKKYPLHMPRRNVSGDYTTVRESTVTACVRQSVYDGYEPCGLYWNEGWGADPLELNEIKERLDIYNLVALGMTAVFEVHYDPERDYDLRGLDSLLRVAIRKQNFDIVARLLESPMTLISSDDEAIAMEIATDFRRTTVPLDDAYLAWELATDVRWSSSQEIAVKIYNMIRDKLSKEGSEIRQREKKRQQSDRYNIVRARTVREFVRKGESGEYELYFYPDRLIEEHELRELKKRLYMYSLIEQGSVFLFIFHYDTQWRYDLPGLESLLGVAIRKQIPEIVEAILWSPTTEVLPADVCLAEEHSTTFGILPSLNGDSRKIYAMVSNKLSEQNRKL